MDAKLEVHESSPQKEAQVSSQTATTTMQYRQQHQHLLQKSLADQQQQQQQPYVLQQMRVGDFGSSCSLVDESSTMQKLKSFTTDEVVAVDSDSAADAYDADVDDVVDVVDAGMKSRSSTADQETHAKVQNEREHIYELFQPWALKTYGDQAKTKTITLRKKARILKALEGKEHSRPDSSKFRFWVKSKAFTTKRPEGFAEVPGSQRKAKPFPPNAVLSDSPSEVDLFVASTSKDFGQRTYRKVAVVEEFFDIIYNVHMELGGRSGMHAGQKRTYRIITETYAFLPREAVTRFLSTCPECKKNLRPTSPSNSSGHNEEPINESSSEVEALNYSSHTESSIEAGPTHKSSAKTNITKAKKRRNSSQVQMTQTQNQDSMTKPSVQLKSEASAVEPLEVPADPTTSSRRHRNKSPNSPPGPSPYSSSCFSDLSGEVAFQYKDKNSAANLPKIRINPNFQHRRPSTPVMPQKQEPVTATAAAHFNPLCLDLAALKTHESLLRYYEFMRRFYGSNAIIGGGDANFVPQSSPIPPLPSPVLAPPIYGSPLLQSLRFPTGATMKKTTLATPSLETKLEQPVSNIIEMSDDDDDDAVVGVDAVAAVAEAEDAATAPPTAKKLKMSHEDMEGMKAFVKTSSSASFNTFSSSLSAFAANSNTAAAVASASSSLPDKQQLEQQQFNSAINLSKSFHFSSNGASTSATNAPIKIETSSSILSTTSSISTSASTDTVTCRSTVLPQHANVATLRIPQVTRTSALPPLDLERLKPITSTYLQLTRSMGLSDEDALRFDNVLSVESF